MVDLEAVKDRVDAEVAARADALLAASHEIHAHPELSYDEHRAATVLTDLLAEGGLEVTTGAYGLPTAFEAVAGTSGPRSPVKV